MASHEEMLALRDAYYDIRDVMSPFVSPWWNNFFEDLTENDAQDEYQALHDDLVDDGYSSPEIRFLTAIAICDIQNEMLEDIEDYETEA